MRGVRGKRRCMELLGMYGSYGGARRVRAKGIVQLICFGGGGWGCMYI